MSSMSSSWTRVIAVSLILIMLLPAIPSAVGGTGRAGDPWWDNDWRCRREIQLNYTGPGQLDGYQVMMNISYSPNMSADFSDLRFTQTVSGQTRVLGHWIQRKMDGQWAMVWVRVEKISTGSASVDMYYGNPSATAGSNGTTTFEFFDDFINDTSSRYTKLMKITGPYSSVLTYHTRDCSGEDALHPPGRMVWSMKMTQYQAEGWGAFWTWGFTQNGSDAMNGTNLTSFNIYANLDTTATTSYPAMLLSTAAATASNSSDRPMVRIEKNKYYDYCITAASGITSARVSDGDNVLFSPSVPMMTDISRYFYMSTFNGISSNPGPNRISWDGGTNGIVYTECSHRNSRMEFYMDYVFFTKYASPEPTYRVLAEETRLSWLEGVFVGLDYSPQHPSEGDLVNITAQLRNPLDEALSLSVSIRVDSRGKDFRSSKEIYTAILSKGARETFLVSTSWLSVGGNFTIWCGVNGTSVGSKDIRVNHIPTITAIPDVILQEGQSWTYRVLAEDLDSGDVISYSDDSPLFSIGPSGTISFTSVNAQVGTSRITITVRDSVGAEAKTAFNLTIGDVNAPPTNVRIISPADGASFPSNTEIALKGAADDADIAHGDVLTFVWYMDGKEVGRGSNLTVGGAGARLDSGVHSIQLRVSDLAGVSNSSAIIGIRVQEGTGTNTTTGDNFGFLLPIAIIMLAISIIVLAVVLRRGRNAQQEDPGYDFQNGRR